MRNLSDLPSDLELEVMIWDNFQLYKLCMKDMARKIIFPRNGNAAKWPRFCSMDGSTNYKKTLHANFT